jgi:WD40 repeat protein
MWGSTLVWDVGPPYREVELPRIRGVQDEGKLTWCAAFLDGSRTLAIGTISGEVELWDVARRLQVGTLSPRSGAVLSLACSPDGRSLATGNQGAVVKLFNLATRQQTISLRGLPSFVFPFDSPWTAISWSPAARSPCSFGRRLRLTS